MSWLHAKHRLKPLDKLIGAAEKLTVGEHPSNAYVVISVGGRPLNAHTALQAVQSMIVGPHSLAKRKIQLRQGCWVINS